MGSATMKPMRRALSLLVPFAVVLAGCGPKSQQFGGTPRTGPPPTVVSLSPSVSEIVASNMDVRQLVGRTKADDYPVSVTAVPVVAEVKPDFEAIAKIKPGIVAYDADLFNEADVKQIEATGAKAFAFKEHTVVGFERELYELSGLLGSETNVSSYVDRIERERSIAESDSPSPKPKVAVVLGGGYVAGTNSFVANVVKIAGGEPVGPAADKFAPMSPEALVAAAPDVIVLATDKTTATKDMAALRAAPGFAATPAVRNGKILALTQNVVLRRGARVDTFIRDLHRGIMRSVQK